MPRPVKCRKVCRMPEISVFAPQNCRKKTPVVLAVDEYEAIRLIDKEHFSQEECAGYMRVGRTTVQQIYTSAREKLALAIVDARPLVIEGGNYVLCDGKEEKCGCGGCKKHKKL
ncbi:MAG: DUF134 domain-containing protein [Ruminococcaceae bacterium]|nr:DUF134 domain-containing protein [Oscillospiraceae bacterium]